MSDKELNDAKKQANLRVLQRIEASILDIVGTATHVVLYQFNTKDQKWEKSNIEGSLFLTKLKPSTQNMVLCSLVILNRAGVENLNVNVTPSFQMQLKDPYLIFRDPSCNNLVRGIWFHDAQERAVIGAMLERIIKVTEERFQAKAAAAPKETRVNQSESKATIVPVTPTSKGRRIASTDSTSDLLSPMQILGLASHEKKLTEQTSVPSEASEKSHAQQSSSILDKESLKLALMTLIEDDRFLDIIHAQYVKVSKTRAAKK